MLPLTVAYKCTLLNIIQINKNHWSILKTNKTPEITFSIEPIFAFCENKILKQLAVGNAIEKDKNIEKNQTINMKGNVYLVNWIHGHYVVYRQKTHSFRSQQNERILTMFHQVNSKSDFVIYFSECKKYHIQYLDTSETFFNLRLNNHRQNVYKADGISASRHFDFKDYIFHTDANFVIIEQIRKNTLIRETKKKLLKQVTNFWIMKLKI